MPTPCHVIEEEAELRQMKEHGERYARLHFHLSLTPEDKLKWGRIYKIVTGQDILDVVRPQSREKSA